MIKIKKILKSFIKFLFITWVLGILLTLIVPFFGGSCKSNVDLKKFDVIIVLGSPASNDCKPGSIMKDRVDKGIQLLRSGVANKILFTGSSVQNSCTEAEVMSDYAISKGISKIDILTEIKAENTFQNAYYSVAQMHKLHLTSAAIVTSEPHIRRACIVFAKYDIEYKMFPANNRPDISKLQLLFWKFGERMILTHHIIFGNPEISKI